MDRLSIKENLILIFLYKSFSVSYIHEIPLPWPLE
jgi:hypothetical protein